MFELGGGGGVPPPDSRHEIKNTVHSGKHTHPFFPYVPFFSGRGTFMPSHARPARSLALGWSNDTAILRATLLEALFSLCVLYNVHTVVRAFFLGIH